MGGITKRGRWAGGTEVRERKKKGARCLLGEVEEDKWDVGGGGRSGWTNQWLHTKSCLWYLALLLG